VISFPPLSGPTPPSVIQIFKARVGELPVLTTTAERDTSPAAFSRNLNLPALGGSHQ